MAPQNFLYFGDNLDVLRQHIRDETVDLVYLDPPFKSDATYNVLFAEKNGSQAAAQIKAFEDTWHWDRAAAAAYQEVVEAGGPVSQVMQAFRTFLGTNDMLAYLSMMAIRLKELHRVLKPTGSLYLHCDATASHYLKILLDAVFGVKNFRNEIIWKRTTAHSDSKRYGRNADTILFYTKSDKWTWNQLYQEYPDEYKRRFRHRDPDGRLWTDDNLTAKGLSGGGYEYEYKGVKSLWRVPITTMERLDREGRLYFTKKGGIRIKRYLDELPGIPLQVIWTDIPPINSQAKERLGYPTQKPEALLERIIRASSNEGDLVLDPFCGCGTTIAVAHRLKRRWIGIDITHLAINLMRVRLRDSFGPEVEKEYTVIGEPVTVKDAEALAKQDPFQFQCWALGLVGARPTDPKKGADKGIDGRLYFHDEGPTTGKTKQVIISVKAGKVQVGHVRDLIGVIQRESAEIGVLISMEPPTSAMRQEAAAAGFYKSPGGTKHPKIQLLTIREILEEGKRIDLPPAGWSENRTFKRAPKREKAQQDPQRQFDLPQE